MASKTEPYGVKWTNQDGQSTIYTHATAASAKASAMDANDNPITMAKWQSIKYVGRNW